MSNEERKDGSGGARDRKQRLSEQLRENLRRRKIQMRLRAQQKADEAGNEELPPHSGQGD